MLLLLMIAEWPQEVVCVLGGGGEGGVIQGAGLNQEDAHLVTPVGKANTSCRFRTGGGPESA